MKLVTLSGGLGNQMFQYAFYLSLKVYDKRVFLYKNKISSHSEHNGYELERLFRIEEDSSSLWLTNMFMVKIWGNIWKHLFFPIKIRERIVHDFSAYSNWLVCTPFYGVHLVGYWQSERYFEQIKEVVRKAFVFDEEMLNDNTKKCLEKMRMANTISLHVRRGDYLLAENVKSLGNICDVRYYQKAVNYFYDIIKEPVFYVFSDDIVWTVTNLSLPDNTVFVDWNNKGDSWQDMFLMSFCKHNIIANSSFSWWGAWLNSNSDKIVIAPAQWIRTCPAPDIVPDSWIRL